MPFPITGRSSGASVARILSSFRAGSKAARKSRAASILNGTETLDTASRGQFVLVDNAAQDVASSHAQHAGNRWGGILQPVKRWQVDPAVRSLRVVLGDVFAEHPLEMTPTEDERPVKASRLTVRTHRSAKAFALGARTGVRMASMPSAAKLLVYLESRSLIR
jgi:hypothetical protein